MPSSVLSEDLFYSGMDSNCSKIPGYSDGLLLFLVSLRNRHIAFSLLCRVPFILHFVSGVSSVGFLHLTFLNS